MREDRHLPTTLRVFAATLFGTLLACASQSQPNLLTLLQKFEAETVFWRQFEIAKEIAAANNREVLPRLQPWLSHADRRSRGNAAYIFGRFGDRRGFDVIVAILNDYSSHRQVESISSNGEPWVKGQIRLDRYYAAHLLGDLKDARAIPILVPLLADPDVNDIVPWSLGQIGHPSAIPPLIATLKNPNPNLRVLATYALTQLNALEALPHLRLLLDDKARCNFDKLETVAEAAQAAIDKLQAKPAR
jgi:HEAT repeat protein